MTATHGYLYIPESGPPVVAHARVLATTAIPLALRGAAVCRDAVVGAAPGLYRARIRTNAPSPYTVTRGARLKGGPISEIGRLAAVARSRTPGRILTAREAQEARLARALADALRLYVLPAASRRPAPVRLEAP